MVGDGGLKFPGADLQVQAFLRDKSRAPGHFLSGAKEVLREREKPAPGKGKEAPAIDPNTRAAVLELERALGTRVRIVGNPKRGKIEIRYFSPEDLQRIYERIVRQ